MYVLRMYRIVLGGVNQVIMLSKWKGKIMKNFSCCKNFARIDLGNSKCDGKPIEDCREAFSNCRISGLL